MAKTDEKWYKSKSNNSNAVYCQILFDKDFNTKKSDTKFADIEIVEELSPVYDYYRPQDNGTKQFVIKLNDVYVVVREGDFISTANGKTFSVIDERTQVSQYILIDAKKD